MSDPIMEFNHVLDNVLLLPSDSPTRAGLKHFGISDIFDLMSIDPRKDLQEEFMYVKPTETDSVGFLYKLTAMTLRNIESLQQWYADQDEDYMAVNWLKLTQLDFRRFS
jgi:hypothetical protein